MENEQKDKFKLTTPMAIVIMGALIMFGIIISKNPNTTLIKGELNQNKEETEQTKEVETNVLALNKADHIRGNIKTAKITLIEYSDTECPFCKDFHTVMKNIIKKYPNDVLWIYRHYPLDSLHSKARGEAIATECVSRIKGEDIFWQYLDMIYENTPSNNGLDENLLFVYAEKFGISKEALNKCITDNSTAINEIINASISDASSSGASGTPFNVIVTKDKTQIPIKGFVDEEYMEQGIQTLLKL